MKNPRKPSAEDRQHGRELSRRRKALGLSQSEVATFLGVSTQQYGKYERGENRISVAAESLDLEQGNGGRFANINRPIAGPTHEKELPVGKHPLQLYSLGTPNGVKVTVMLEELLALGHKGAEYDAWLINIGEGDQFGSGFVDINPNSKIPALMDPQRPKPMRVFESGRDPAVSRRKVRRVPAEGSAASGPRRCPGCSGRWAAAPFLGGGFGHFYAYAPRRWNIRSTAMRWRVKRQLDVLDRRLADNEYRRRRRVHDCRYGDLALVWRDGEGHEAL
jgi:DNA-binding XRE family transcriptional regulator